MTASIVEPKAAGFFHDLLSVAGRALRSIPREPEVLAPALFILVKSLEKGEKRNFKLYAARNSASADLKIVQLFDALDWAQQQKEWGKVMKPFKMLGSGQGYDFNTRKILK